MKKILLSILALICLGASAQIERSYTFDFSKPTTLLPEGITAKPTAGGTVPITDKVFKTADGEISVSFAYGSLSMGAYITTSTEALGLKPYLETTRTTSLKLTSLSAGITKITFSLASQPDLEFVSTVPGDKTGTYEPQEDGWVWTSGGVSNVTGLTFVNGGTPSTIYQMTVTYLMPRAILTPTVTPADNSTVDKIDQIVLTFGSDDVMSAGDGTFSLKDANGTVYSMTAAYSGNKVTLSPSAAITTDGTYTLTVGEGAFKNAEGYVNSAASYTLKLVSPFNIQSISLAEGTVTEIPSGIILTFPGSVVVDATKKARLTDASGDLKRTATPETTATEGQVRLVFANTTSVTANGIYSLTIPAGMVKDATETHQNPETIFTYNIGDIASSELQAKAGTLLAYTGLGYPKTDDAARTTLAGLASTASTSDYNTAIADYLKSANVEMPVSGKWYYISSVAGDGSTRLYLQNENGLISLTNVASKAVPFKVTESSGNYAFATADNQYLLLPGSTASSLSASQTAANGLKLAKLTISGMDAEKAFGLFSISDGSGFARVNVTDRTFATDNSLGLAYFTSAFTNGFKLESVPDSEIPVPDAAYTLSPASGSTLSVLNTITVTFTGLNNVAKGSGCESLIRLTKGSTNYNPETVTLATGTTNSYVLTFSGVTSGSYTLTIGKGVFTYSYEGITASVQEITGTYTVSTGDDFITDLLKYTNGTEDWSTYFKESVGADEPIKDVDLNNFTLYNTRGGEYGLLPAAEQSVTLLNYYTNDKIVDAHFVTVAANDPLMKELPEGAHAIKLVLDKAITAGSVPSGTYVWVIPAGTFGDTNFAKYQADKTSIDKNQCHVNERLTYVLTVDNSRAGQGSEPSTPEETPSDAVLKKAQEALAYTGVGYPSATSTAREALQNCVTNKKGSDDVVEARIKDFKATSDIELPATGNYYAISAVSADGAEAFVQYEAGALLLTKDATKASPFLATNNNGVTVTLQTLDGQYLKVLTGNGLSNTYDSNANNLFLSRLSAGDAEATFGLVSIQGTLNGAQNVNAQVNTANSEFTTAAGNTLVFEGAVTSGFRFTGVDKTSIPAPKAEYTLTPANGATLTSLSTVTVTFTNLEGVAIADQSKISLTGAKGTTIKVVSVGASDSNAGEFRLTFPSLEGDDYTLTIGEGAFTFDFLGRTEQVQAITATYSLLQYPAEEVLALARQLLTNTGVGYPSADSQERTALKTLADSGMGSDNAYWNAINAYRAATDVELPATGGFYRISAHTSASTMSYLTYKGGRLSFTGSQTAATAFQATANSDGTVTLATLDGKYLKLPTSGDDNIGTEAVRLTIARLQVEGASDIETYGKVSISSGGKYAVVDVPSAVVLEARTAPVHTASATSAFSFVEVDKSELQMPEMEYTLSPAQGSEVKRLEKVTITFNTQAAVTLVDESLINLAGNHAGNETNSPLEVTMTAGNTFELSFINLRKDNYILTIGKGTFAVNFLGEKTQVQEITARYSVTEEPTVAVDYADQYEVTWVEAVPEDTYVKDTYLNNFTLESNEPIILAEPAKAVIISNSFGNEKARGYLTYPENARAVGGAAGNAFSVKLVLDKEIKEGDLRAGEYTITIPAGTFGDANYGKYMDDPASVALGNCHVNETLVFKVMVDNAIVSGIRGISVDTSDGSAPVYDQNGVRVSILRPGQIYIQNGRKFVIKK